MPSNASPTKRLRRDAKKRLSNKSKISALRTTLKKSRADSSNTSLAIQAQKALAMAATKGIIHKNTAARKTSRLMKKMNAAAQAL
jgi:small subunit ribosomal protein S20